MTAEQKTAPPLITFENVTLGYGGIPVLQAIDLVVRQGDFLGLVGPNGAGKTTLLRGIIGLLKPSQGRFFLGPSPGSKDPVLGYVPQLQNLDAIYPLTVKEVVRMGGFTRKSLGSPTENGLLEECLAGVGMEDSVGRVFSRLSSGQKQRVLIARALYTRADLLLLDEPTSGADHEAGKRIMALLRKLHREGRTILLICHELDTVQQAVREILWVSGGRVVRDAPTQLLSEERIQRIYKDQG